MSLIKDNFSSPFTKRGIQVMILHKKSLKNQGFQGVYFGAPKKFFLVAGVIYCSVAVYKMLSEKPATAFATQSSSTCHR